MPGLLSLPEELFCKISDFVHPKTVIDWACTCKVLYRCSLRALNTHKQRRSDFRVVHDRNPITIPSLLRNSLSEPEILWYVRSLDVWDLREKFEEWKSPVFTEMNPYDWETEEFLDWPEKRHDYSNLNTTFYGDEELERYRSILSGLLRLEEPLVDKWMNRLRSGSDEPLKVLLIAMSPRLTKATFVEYDSWQSELKYHPFRLLASTLRALSPLPSTLWPCFQNLKIVYVGYYTELRHPEDGFYPHSSVIAPLFLLPAIEELHLHLLMGEDVDQESDQEDDEEYVQSPKPYVWGWEVGRSSCRNLAFHICELATETIASFIGATHSLRCLSGVTNDDEIISALLKHSKHSLETVVFEESSPRPKPSTASRVSFESFSRLAHIELPQSQLIDMSTYEPSQIEYNADDSINLEKSVFGNTDRFDLRTFLPPTLQTLKINQNNTPILDHEIEDLVHQLVALVNAKLSPTNGAFASLTAICLAYLTLTPDSSHWGGYKPTRLNVWLGDFRRVCEEAEVRIHTDRRTPWIEASSGDPVPCSLCRPETDRLDSAPVIPGEEG